MLHSQELDKGFLVGGGAPITKNLRVKEALTLAFMAV